jgi:hypothetical protein
MSPAAADDAAMRRLSWPLLCLAAGCGGPAATEPRPAGHVRMVALLAERATAGSAVNPFFGDGPLRRLTRELEQRGDAADWRLRLDTAAAALRHGDARRSIELLCSAADGLRQGRLAGDAAAALAVSYQLGVSWLRLAETQNCCARPTHESCIVPIVGTGRHTATEGSQRAIECFVEVLRNTPAGDYWHYAAMWLLNIAHMTLGSYPDGVPAAWQLPAAAFAPECDFPRFRDVAPAVGLDTNGTAGGVVVDDFDGDEWLDLIVSDWAPDGQLRCFRNQRDGSFADATEAAGLTGITGGLHLVHADYDEDGDLDVLVLRGGWWFECGLLPCSLLQNDGRGRFTDVTFAVGLGERQLPTQTAAFADYDLDGDLDLYIGSESSPRVRCASQLYRNDGGRFTDVARAAGVTNDAYAKGVAWGDVDGDRWPDLYVSNIDGANRLYRNRGDGTFVDAAAAAGVLAPAAGFATWFWDFDADGAADLFVANYDTGCAHLASYLRGGSLPFATMRLYRGDGAGGFVDVTRAAGLAVPAMPMGCNFGDLDNDGWLDCYLGTGDPQYASLMPNLMFRNRGGAAFDGVTMAGGFGHLQKGHGVAFADLDHDGDQDVFEVMGGAYPGDAFRNVLFENPGFGNRWLTVRLVGTASARCAIGASLCVTVREGGRRRTIRRGVDAGSSFGGNPLRQTLGLGRAEAIERCEVCWPRTGRVQVVDDVPLDAVIRIVEGRAGWERIAVGAVPFRRR